MKDTKLIKQWAWVITFLGIACGALVDIMKTVVEILEDKDNEV
jgi:hypothetical protein